VSGTSRRIQALHFLLCTVSSLSSRCFATRRNVLLHCNVGLLNIAPSTLIPARSRRNAVNNRIRGPQSALTEFLASQGISAADISSDYQRRQREAEIQAAEDAANDEKEGASEGDSGEDPVERKKRKRKEEQALNKIKQTKEFKKRKYEERRDHGSDADDDDALARKMMSSNKPLPGQLENCDICEKRFTVTPYSKTGPDGGLLCGKCSKELKDEEKKSERAAKKKAPQSRGRKRQTESDRMMGDVKPGAKSLVDACVRKVADVVNDVDDFGDMPESLLDRLSQILSKKRVLTPRTLDLFLRDDIDHIDVYDGGKLETEDFERIFAIMHHLQSVNLRFAGQMKDSALRYLIDKCNNLHELQLGATNLISEKAWLELFHQRGAQLTSFKASEVQEHFSDSVVLEMAHRCTSLKRLKLRACSHLTETSVKALYKLTSLEHLTLAVAQDDTTTQTLVELVAVLGPKLKTLCLEGFDYDDGVTSTDEDDEDASSSADMAEKPKKPSHHDEVLLAIRHHCKQLRKLRFTRNSNCSDNAFSSLFEGWENKPLRHIDLSKCRWVDNANPDGPGELQIGVAGNAFKSLMKHSGQALQVLDLQSCRHISRLALTDVFDGKKQYPELRRIDLSFVSQVDEEVMAGIFRSCPALTKLVVFACFNARGAAIPAGIAVIGLPNPQDSIVIQGFADDLLSKSMA
jgi:DNA repair protein RAD7